MPTPEEILDKYAIGCTAGQYDIEVEKAYEAMNVYAQQEAIEFSEWKDKNFITTIGADSDVELIYRPRFMNLAGENKFTITELYQLFKQQKP